MSILAAQLLSLRFYRVVNVDVSGTLGLLAGQPFTVYLHSQVRQSVGSCSGVNCRPTCVCQVCDIRIQNRNIYSLLPKTIYNKFIHRLCYCSRKQYELVAYLQY